MERSRSRLEFQVKIYCAGAHHHNSLLERGLIRHAFFSFLDVKNASPKFWDRIAAAIVKGNVDSIMDSGAHSFFTSAPGLKAATNFKRVGVDPDIQKPQSFFDKYLAWIKHSAGTVGYFAELDIGKITGQATVYKWREAVLKSGFAEKCIIVYHPDCETWDEFTARAKDWPSRFIGLEGPGAGGNVDYMKCVKWCYERGIRVHGFACVNEKYVKNIPFYSVDSTSWLSGQMFGAYSLRTGFGQVRQIRISKPTNKREQTRFTRHFLKGELAPMLAASGKESKELLLRSGASSMSKMSDDLTQLWIARGVDWNAAIKANSQARTRKAQARPRPKHKTDS